MQKVLHTAYVDYALNDDLLTATFKKGLQINLAIAREIVESRLKLTGRKQIAVLILDRGVVSINLEARRYFSSAEASKRISAVALVPYTVYGMVLSSFFTSVNQPEMTVKIFKKKDAALQWLRQFIT